MDHKPLSGDDSSSHGDGLLHWVSWPTMNCEAIQTKTLCRWGVVRPSDVAHQVLERGDQGPCTNWHCEAFTIQSHSARDDPRLCK